LNVGKRDHERHRIERRWLEADGEVEGFRLFGNRMNDNAADAEALGRIDDARCTVSKQRPSQASTLPGAIYRKAREQSHRYRVWHISPKAAKRSADTDGSGSYSVIRNDTLTVSDNKCARGTGDLVAASATLQPVVKRRHT
jgi:hypothetical protein